MAYLHNDREQFKDAIYLAYDQTGIMVQAIEKDYYVTMLLKILSEKIPYIVFKGGTSLSKCHKVIPANARKIFDIQPGDNLLILGDEEQGIAILKEKSFLEHLRLMERMRHMESGE